MYEDFILTIITALVDCLAHAIPSVSHEKIEKNGFKVGKVASYICGWSEERAWFYYVKFAEIA